METKQTNLMSGRKYTPAATTDIRELFRSVDPRWNERPSDMESRETVRNRINGWKS